MRLVEVNLDRIDRNTHVFGYLSVGLTVKIFPLEDFLSPGRQILYFFFKEDPPGLNNFFHFVGPGGGFPVAPEILFFLPGVRGYFFQFIEYPVSRDLENI